ncbi:MAG: ribonuclease III [Oscillospiraceae bacterium]|nr:ribonuclease III [Oscillospiraceae bacterium]
MNFQLSEKEARQFSPLTMAFLGDCVYELMVRSAIVEAGSTPVGNLHSAKIKLVCAGFQARASEALLEQFTAEELSVFQRGKNAAGNTVPRNATPADYRKATGLEAVFGYLQLSGNTQRLEALFSAIWDMREELLLQNQEKTTKN